ncbi:hypothetical protein THAOC_16376, partial [Thalassiosira oceanica]
MLSSTPVRLIVALVRDFLSPLPTAHPLKPQTLSPARVAAPLDENAKRRREYNHVLIRPSASVRADAPSSGAMCSKNPRARSGSGFPGRGHPDKARELQYPTNPAARAIRARGSSSKLPSSLGSRDDVGGCSDGVLLVFAVSLAPPRRTRPPRAVAFQQRGRDTRRGDGAEGSRHSPPAPGDGVSLGLHPGEALEGGKDGSDLR